MIVHSHPPTPPDLRSAPPPPKSSGMKVDLHVILLAMRRHWRWVFCLGIMLATVGAVATCMLIRPKYQASATIQIRSQVPYVAFEPNHNEQIASKYFMQTQVELLRNPIVLAPTSRRDEVASLEELQQQRDPAQWLADGLSVRKVGKSELFSVSFTSTSPRVSQTVVNAIIDQYFGIQKEGEASRDQKVIDLLEDEIKRRQKELTEMRNELKKIVDQAIQNGMHLNNPLAIGTSNSSLLNPSSELLTRLTDAEVELEILEAQVMAEKKHGSNNKEIPQDALNKMIANDIEMKRLHFRIQKLRAQLHETERIAMGGKKNPHYQRIDNELKRVKEIAHNYASKLLYQSEEELRDTTWRRQRDAFLKQQHDLESHRMMVTLLRQRYSEQLAKLRQDNNETLDIEFRRTELLRAESVLERISNRAMALRTEQRAPERVTLRQRAQLPRYPISRYPFKEILLAIFAGFAMPFGLALLIEAARPKVNGGESLKRNAHLNVLGEVAKIPSRRSPLGKPSAKRPNRSALKFEESVDALRTNLFLSENWEKARTFAITSAVNSEGKTSIATQLALSVSRMRGVKALLIDCDLRIPQLHKYFNLPLTPGLADVLAGELEPSQAVLNTWVERLDVLPAGQLETNPYSLFNADIMEKIVAWAEQQYDYVILDTPPILAASEALVAAKAADVSILCTMQNVSRFDQIRRACERLTVVGSPPIGAILNGVSCSNGKYSYRNYDAPRPHKASSTTV